MNSRMARFWSLLVLVLITSPGSASARWLPAEIAEVRAFVYDYTQEEGNESLLKAGRIHKGVINKGGAVLSEQQIGQLKDALRSKKRREPGAFCYFPHHGFVFYDAAGRAMGHIELCFQCGNVKSSPRGLPETEWDWKAIKAILHELEIPVLKEDKDYTALFEGKAPLVDGPNLREARKGTLTLDGGETVDFDVPKGAIFSDDGVLTLYPGDEVHLEYAEKEGVLVDPRVVAKVTAPERTITFKMRNEKGMTMVTRATKILQTVAMDCDHRGIDGQGFARTNLRPTEKGLMAFDSWPGTVWMVRLKNFEVTDRSASEVYRERMAK